MDKKRRIRYYNDLQINLIDNMEDLRIHADMFPENPRNIYRACLAGVRR